jgi:hypothetical protein
VSFEILASSPLLIPHVRNPGGKGGRRIHAGRVGDDFAVRVDSSGKTPSLTVYGSADAAVHAFNAELERAGRDGLQSNPEPVPLRRQDLT